MKTEKLSSVLRVGDCFLIADEVNRLYLTSFHSSDGFLCVTNKNACFFADSRYFEDAQREITEVEVRLYDSFDRVTEYMKENGIKNVFISKERTAIAEFERYKMLLKDCSVIPDAGIDKILNEMRAVKDKDEKSKIIKAQRIAEKAFSEVLGFIKVGVSESEIAAFLEYSMRRHAGQGTSFETIALCGKSTSVPHGVPGERKIENGDFITMDFGAVYKGYRSDMTRTVAVGKISEEKKKVYETVLRAQESAIAVIKDGLSCAEGDRAAREVIEKAGYGKYFGHSTGHGVGVEIHEKPNLSPRSDMTLKSGNVVTVEPGIYIPGEFGVRIEDFGMVTKDGFENFTKAPKELIVL